MGDKFKVHAYRKVRDGYQSTAKGRHQPEEYAFVTVYRGGSIFRAVAALISAKRSCGMVKLEWR